MKGIIPRCHASFILDTLEFMKAGGRCSSVVAFGANLLSLKPCIEVDNTDGSMHVGKKYRGTLKKVLPLYVRDKLAQYGKVKQDGYALIPLSVYFRGSLVKVEVALARGKKLYDKRDDAAKKDAKRQIDRAMKGR